VTLPLTGITVLSLEHAVAAPFVTRQFSARDPGRIVVSVNWLGDHTAAILAELGHDALYESRS
jgi:hypothetical protein